MNYAPTALSKYWNFRAAILITTYTGCNSSVVSLGTLRNRAIESAGEFFDDRLQGDAVRSLSLLPEKALRRADAIDVLLLDRPRMAAVVRSLGSCQECKWWNNGDSSNDCMIPQTKTMAWGAFCGLRKLRCLPFLATA